MTDSALEVIRGTIWRHTACSDAFAIEAAQAVLDALARSGKMIAPREPTEAMLRAALDRAVTGEGRRWLDEFYGEIYRAMIAQAQTETEGNKNLTQREGRE